MPRGSGPDLVVATCIHGVIRAFPVANRRTLEQLDEWLVQIKSRLEAARADPSRIVARPLSQPDHPARAGARGTGLPGAAQSRDGHHQRRLAEVAALHDIGCTVFADVATLRHAKKAIATGVDELVLLTAGEGGQTGW